MSYFIFVDNSNVWIEGKYGSSVAQGKARDIFEAHYLGLEDMSWRIDFGKLLKCITNNNVADIKKAKLFGSKPPENDSLWNAAKRANFDPSIFDRNVADKEKAVDTSIIIEVMECLYEEAQAGDTFVLVTGDKDFLPVIKKIKDKQCDVIVAFWPNASRELMYSVGDNFLDLLPIIQNITY